MLRTSRATLTKRTLIRAVYPTQSELSCKELPLAQNEEIGRNFILHPLFKSFFDQATTALLRHIGI